MKGDGRDPIRPMELLVLVHVGIFMAAATWLFGGNAGWVRPYLSVWGSLGMALTVAACLQGPHRAGDRRILIALWPFALFNLLVLVSCATPGFIEIHRGDAEFYTPANLPLWRPSAAVPAEAMGGLWLFDGIYLSCFNLALAVRRRRSLRGLLLAVVFNALALSVFGTVQKLTGAKGLFFGLVPSVQTFFFSSFIYHNHWGAFAVLMAAASLGLVAHYGRRRSGRDFMHSPGLGGLVIVLFIAATAPLSTSRSCTALMILLLGGAFVGWAARLVRRRRTLNESAAPALLAAGAGAAAALAGILYVARDSIQIRVAATESQIAAMRAHDSLGSRVALYADTWRMAEDRLWFGWGMGSFPYVFPIYNSLDHPNSVDHLPNNYHDAHNDWLQSAAEHGLAGTAAAGLCGLVPFILLRKRSVSSPPTRQLLAGCGLILLYAGIEFPFGNVAVVLSWWFCFFSALAYARLEVRSADLRPPAPVPSPDFP
jgi:O-antigen ligase